MSRELILEKLYPASYAEGTISQKIKLMSLASYTLGKIKVQFLKNDFAPEFTPADKRNANFAKIVPCELRSRCN